MDVVSGGIIDNLRRIRGPVTGQCAVVVIGLPAATAD